jgi:hypothetical protein
VGEIPAQNKKRWKNILLWYSGKRLMTLT